MFCLNVSLYFLIILLQSSSACNMISFSGGGAFGAVEIGMLQKLINDNKITENPNILTGVSAGGLNAGFLSSSLSEKSLVDSIVDLTHVYESIITADIYDLKWNTSSWSIYQTTPLNDTIHIVLSKYNNSDTQPLTFIGASNLETGLLDIIRYDTLNGIEDRARLLLATSAIPVIFPPVKWNNTLYVDGGLISNEIIFEAIPFLQCDEPTIWYFEPTYSLNKIAPITDFYKYIERIFSIVTNGFDNQLQKILQDKSSICPQNKTYSLINVCHPDTDGIELLKKYSILDFDKGSELLNIGYKYIKCDSWTFCQ